MQKEDMITTEEFCSNHHVEISFIQELESYGLAETIVIEDTSYVPVSSIGRIEKIIRMYFDLGINMEGIDAISHLLQKLESMHEEIGILKKRLDFYKEEE
jgi:hypothetical protein